MKISQETIDSMIPELNKLVDRYKSRFGNVGFKHLHLNGKVHLIDRVDVPSRIEKVADSSVGMYDDEQDEIYFIRENLAEEVEATSDNIRRQTRMDFGFDDYETYILMALLCHESIIHRSTKTVWLDGDVLDLYNDLHYTLLESEGSGENYEFLRDGRSRIKTRGLRNRVFNGDEEEAKVDMTKQLDELVVHVLTGRVLGLQTMEANPGLTYSQSQLPYALVGGRIFDEEILVRTAKMLDGGALTFKFIRDYLSGRIPHRVQQVASKYFKHKETETALTNVFLTMVYGLPEGLSELYEKVYK